MSTNANVNLKIRELRLRGFPAGDRIRIGDAIRRELEALIRRHGLTEFTTDGVDISTLNAGEFKFRFGARAQTVGRRVARRIHGALNGERRAS